MVYETVIKLLGFRQNATVDANFGSSEILSRAA